MTSTTEYSIEQDEMERRKRAFTTLTLSIVLSVTLCSLDYIMAVPKVTLPIIVVLCLLLFLARFFVHRSTDKFGARKIVLSETSLKNVSGSSASEIALDEICFLRIKTTVRRTIREITLRTLDGARFGLSGIADFERFRIELTERLGQDVEVRELQEPIDFDHPWFYVFFGAFVGCSMAGLVRLAPLLSHGTVKTFNLVTSIFVLSVGIFWLFTKPGVATYGRKVRPADLTFGVLLIGVGLFLGSCALVTI